MRPDKQHLAAQETLAKNQIQRSELTKQAKRQMEKDLLEKKIYAKRVLSSIVIACVGVFALIGVIVGSRVYLRHSFKPSDAFCVARRFIGAVADAKDLEQGYAAVDTVLGPEVHTPDYNRSMFWGTYRPHLYLGVKSREKEPLLFGMAWYDGKNMFPIRHGSEENENVLFRWEAHDGRFYGREYIFDRQNNMELHVRFLKHFDGRSWLVRVESVRHVARFPMQIIFYFVSESESLAKEPRGGSAIPLSVNVSPDLDTSSVASSDLGEGAFHSSPELHITGGLNGGDRSRPFTASVADLLGEGQEFQWQAFGSHRETDPWNIDLRSQRNLRRVTAHGQHNKPLQRWNGIVLKKRVDRDFRFEIRFTEHKSHQKTPRFTDPCVNDVLFDSREEAFNAKFERTFGLHSSVLPQLRQTASGLPSDAVFEQMARSGLSNLLGGIGYWHGKYLVKKSKTEVVEVGPSSLFSGVPSRAKFPRGFLWDEGFHQLLVAKWDSEISKDVILHWMRGCMQWDGMGKDGWIPREQVLGTEPRTRIPAEFIPQEPTHANPPAMIIQVQNFALEQLKHLQKNTNRDTKAMDPVRTPFSKTTEKCGAEEPSLWGTPSIPSECDDDTSDASAATTTAKSTTTSESSTPRLCKHDSFLQDVLPYLRKWTKWFMSTQCGNCTKADGEPSTIEELKFRWRSRNGYHLLACGLDDYARPHCPKDGKHERHVDLHSWLAMLTETMRSIEGIMTAVSEEEDTPMSSRASKASGPSRAEWEEALNALHWDNDLKQYSDVTGCNPKAPVTKQLKDGRTVPNPMQGPHFSPYFGYVNLFPVLLMVTEDKNKACKVIQDAKAKLSAGYGLQSMSNRSRSALQRNQHDDYWTGPIWININYLFLRALKHKYNDLCGADARSVYDSVRTDLIRNIGKEFERTGNLWENYDISTGRGRGTAPFTGWTTLILLIMSEAYV